jgi:hypothetical protein
MARIAIAPCAIRIRASRLSLVRGSSDSDERRCNVATTWGGSYKRVGATDLLR